MRVSPQRNQSLRFMFTLGALLATVTHGTYITDSWAMLSNRNVNTCNLLVWTDGLGKNQVNKQTLCNLTGRHVRHRHSRTDELWCTIGGMAHRPRCVDIPRNLTLCYGIDYQQMRLPNLLQHETMDEVTQQAMSWVPLLGLHCHPDAQLFLCALFAPVCLTVDKPIPPCRSLCTAVQAGCEKRMRMYGFPWPEMLHCHQFPRNTDMCIQPRQNMPNASCELCSQVDTYENILDNYCRSEYVMKVRLRQVASSKCTVQIGRSLKNNDQSSLDGHNLRRDGRTRSRRARRVFRGQTVHFMADHRDCDCEFQRQVKHDKKKLRKQRYLLMANRATQGDVVASLLLPWKRDKQFKRAIRTFRKIDCSSLGRVIRDRARRRQPTVYPGPYTTRYDEPFYWN